MRNTTLKLIGTNQFCCSL